MARLSWPTEVDLSTYHLHTEMVCLWCVNISSNWTAHTATTLIKTKALPLNKSASFVYQNRYLLSSKMYAIQFISRKMQLLSNRSHRKILQVPINSYKCYYKEYNRLNFITIHTSIFHLQPQDNLHCSTYWHTRQNSLKSCCLQNQQNHVNH